MNDSANPTPRSRDGPTENEPSVDELFDVLGDERRRRVLAVLAERQSPIDAKQLAFAVATRGNDDTVTLSESVVEDVHVTLHHVHLPKLDEAGLVDFDRDDHTVATTTAADAVPIDIE